MSHVKEYYYLKSNPKDTAVKHWFFDKGPMPLLWMCEGTFNLIPRETIANFLQHDKDQRKLGRVLGGTLDLAHCNSMAIDCAAGRALSPPEDFHQNNPKHPEQG